MRINTRLKLAVSAPVFMALFISLALFFSYQAMEKDWKNGSLVRRIRSSVTELNTFVQSYIHYHEERPKRQFLVEYDSMTQLIAGIRLRNPEQQRLLDRIRLNSESMKDLFLRLVSNYEPSDTAGSAELLAKAEERLEGQLLIRSRDMDADASRLRSMVDDDIRSAQTRTFILILFVVLFTTVPLTIVLIRMMKSITTSLSTLRKGTEVIGAGNLGHRIGMTTPDELGDLSHAVDHMTEQLQAVTVSKDELQHEVAERRRAEELLLENEGRLERSQEIAHLGGWELDLVDNILTWSDEVYRIFGLQPREFDASYEAFLEAVHPDDREAVNAAYSDSLREGRDTYEIEHRVVRKSSGEIRYVHEKCAHVRDETGRIIRSVGMVHDITERKRAEESLKLAYAELDQIFNTTATGMRVIDRGFTMLRVNETFRVLSGIGKDEGAGKKCYEVFPGDMCGTDNCPVTRILKGEERVECEGEKVRIDGTIIPCIMAATPFRGQGGEVIGIVESFKDITERKQAEEDIKKLNDDLKHHVVQLEESNKELEAFSYSVSHDLRSPLRGIDGFSQALLEDYADKLDEEGKDYLQRVRAGSQRMAQLIDDLLNLSRVTRSEMKHEQVDLSRIAKDIADGLGKSQPERDVEFVIAEGLTTKGDERLLRAAMENLFSNAWKFTSIHPKGRIEFGVAQRDGKTVCFIKDDGAGFDMTYVEKLFRPFQRLHLPSDFPGTGIGLATVQRIIHRHGGRVWIEGEVEKGATVYFTLG